MAAFKYDVKPVAFTPALTAAKPPQESAAKCGFACHTNVKERSLRLHELRAQMKLNNEQAVRTDSQDVKQPVYDPQPSAASDRANNQNHSCADLITIVERELASFIAAVTELYGCEQARLSALDWFDELDLMADPRASTTSAWRTVTIAASVRLASRLNGARHIDN